MTDTGFHQLFPHALTLIICVALFCFSLLPQKKLVKLLRRLSLVWLAVLLLSLSQPPHSLHLLAWVAMVPLLLIMFEAGGVANALLFWLAGWLFFLINLGWLRQVTVAGLLMLSLYLSWYFLGFGLLIRWIHRRLRLPLALSAPVIWVGLEYLRSFVLTGFPWLLMGHSQHANLLLIQSADFAGAYGVSFVLLAVNGFLAQLIRKLWDKRQGRHVRGKRLLPELVIALALVVCSCAYGWYRLSYTDFQVGPTVTLVQGSIPQRLKISGQSEKEIFEKHMRLSWGSVEATDLIVWPETMVLGVFSGGRIWEADQKLEMHNGLVELARGRQVPLLIGVLSLDFKRGRVTRVLPDGETVLVDLGSADGVRLADDLDLYRGTEVVAQLRVLKVTRDSCVARWQPGPAANRTRPREGDAVALQLWHNSALYFSQAGNILDRYDKLHLVPFGEYTPLKHYFPFLANLVPYEKSLVPGSVPTTFHLQEEKGDKFGVVICFEDTMPAVARRFAQEGIDFLVNISNDAWFDGGWFGDTGEVDQHLAQACFRAVENRVPIARASNTGISCLVRSDGKVTDILTDDLGQFRKVAGTLTARLRLDTRRTFYTRFGDVFARCCLGAGVVLLLTALTLAIWARTKSQDFC